MAKELTKQHMFLQNAHIKQFNSDRQIEKYLKQHSDEEWEEVKHPTNFESSNKYMINNKGQILKTNAGYLGDLFECDLDDYFEATRVGKNGQEYLLLVEFFKKFEEKNVEEYLLKAYEKLGINSENRYRKYKIKDIDEWISNEFATKLSPNFDDEEIFASLLIIIGEILRSVGLNKTHWEVKEHLFFDKKTKIYIPYLADEDEKIWNIYEILRNHLLTQEGSWKKVATGTYNKALKSKQTLEEFEEEFNRRFMIFSRLNY